MSPACPDRECEHDAIPERGCVVKWRREYKPFGGKTMADQSKRTDAILAAYEEAHGHFMMSFLVAAELAPDLTYEELIEYIRIGETLDVDHAEQKRQQRVMIELAQVSSTAAQPFEYIARLLAVTERCTEQLRDRTEEFSKLIRCHLEKQEWHE
jgi:hypothetical protein